MKIRDERVETRHYSVGVFLERAIGALKPDLKRGIRHIVLMDRVMNLKKPASGQYIAVPGTEWHDIELYFDHYSGIPKEMSGNQVFLGALAVRTLLHEIYHHKLIYLGHAPRPRFTNEQRAADRWAEATLAELIPTIFAGDEFKEQREEIRKKTKSNQAL